MKNKNLKVLAGAATAASMMFGSMAPGIAGMMNSPLVMNVFAEETGSITLDNPQAGETYTAYKIFDVNYDKTAPEKYSYTIEKNSPVIAEGSPWKLAVETYFDLYEPAGNSNIYVAKMKRGMTAGGFATELESAMGEGFSIHGVSKTPTVVDDVVQPIHWTGLDLGYYFVTGNADTHALCNLTTTNPTSTIYDKNHIDFGKTDDKADVEFGDTVKYTIDGKVPDTTGYDSYTYKITDKMSSGLTFGKNVVVKIGNETKTEGTDYSITYTKSEGAATEDGFELNIFMQKTDASGKTINKYVPGTAITVEYTAVVNKNAIAKVEENYAELEYSNKPGTEETTKTHDRETVYSCQVVVDKYVDQNEAEGIDKDKSTKLAGAKFVLMRKETVDGREQKLYYKLDQNGKVQWTDDINEALKKETDNEGYAAFDGLSSRVYYLVETEAPAGYNLLKDEIRVEAFATNNTEVDAEYEKENDNRLTLTTKQEVGNNKGTELPSTGGMGTTILYTAGGILVVGAGALLAVRKKREEA